MFLSPTDQSDLLNFLPNITTDEKLNTDYGVISSAIPEKTASGITTSQSTEDLITSSSINIKDTNTPVHTHNNIDALTGIKDSKPGIQPRYITPGDPDDDYYVVRPGEIVDKINLDGVGLLEYKDGSGGFCTGTLVGDGKYIITAAHCLSGQDANNIQIRFNLPNGDVTVPGKEIFINPQYDEWLLVNDIAILELKKPAPASVPRYKIYRGNKEVGPETLKVGYGTTGQIEEITNLGFEVKRSGHNVYDSLLNANQFSNRAKFEEIFGFGGDIPPNTQLAYDFDNGKSANDAFGKIFGKPHLGLGKEEVFAGHGDSGGPTFIDGKIVAVTSYTIGETYGVTTDIDDIENHSYGEIAVDTRVAAYSKWIDRVISGKPPTNDLFANRIQLKGESIKVTGDNIRATVEESEPLIAGNIATETVWWSWKAPRNMTVNLNTFGSNFDTVLGVYTNVNSPGLNLVADNDDTSSFQSQVIFNAKIGTNYLFAVGSVNSPGNIQLNLQPINPQIGFDYNGDNQLDLLWHNQKNGQNQVWLMGGEDLYSGINRNSLLFLPSQEAKNWQIVSTGKFNNDKTPDLVWRNSSTGENQLWLMGEMNGQNTSIKAKVDLPKQTNQDWQIVATGDINKDKKVDLIWRNNKTGKNQVWLMSGTERKEIVDLPTQTNVNWDIVGAGDWNSDRQIDLLWRNQKSGENQIWLMNGLQKKSVVNIKSEKSPWQIVGTGDFNNDNDTDIIWRNPQTGENKLWQMNGSKFDKIIVLPSRTSQDWVTIV
jgi:hypothetical protein